MSRSASSRAKSGYGEPGHKAAPIGKPFHQGGQRNNVSQSETQAAEDSVGKPEEPNIAVRKARQGYAKAVANPRGCSYYPRTNPSHPETAEKGGKSQNKDRY